MAAGEVGAGGDVAPLVGTANLQYAAVATVQLGKVVTLQQAVAELGVADALVFAVDALLYRFLLDHLVDGEVLTDVAQELQCAHAAKPVVVVGHDGGVVAVKAQERRYLAADFFYPAGNHVRGVQLALGSLEAGVADHAGGAAHQGDRLVAGLLEALQHQYRYQMAQVQAVGGGVEAAIQGHAFLGQQFL
ncbi:hypothetical protein QF022_002419 [Vogesella perlucida]|nr:hypothetical protein [Vogesella perlucida]